METAQGGRNHVKKQLPGWAVLLIITLVAGLALGGTYALTKDPIEQQALLTADNARKAALPDAESFEELTLEEGASVDWAYAGLKNGETVGYVAQKTVNGFGGKVEVIAGVDTQQAPDTFSIGGISVGGSSFSETAGLGARSKEPAFTEQFNGKIYPVSYIKAGGTPTESTVDALTSATITTTAVVNGVNDIVKYIKGDVMGIAGVEMPAKPADGVFSASEKGFRGPVYVEAAFDSAGKVTYMSVGDENFAEDIGMGVVEPDFMIQFIGKQVPLEVADIDVIAGATISSSAVVKALNTAYAVAGGAEIVVPETPTMPEKPADGVFSASEQGFAGPVYVEAAFDEEGKITYLGVGDDKFAETEGFGARALEAEEQYPFIGKQMPLELGDVDALTGATFTKTAIVNGLNKAYAASKGEVIEEPVKEEATLPEKPAEGVFSASEQGFAGSVYVEAAFDGEGKVSYIKVGDDKFAETAGFGANALLPENQAAFIGKQMPLELGDVDVLTGATFTKTAIVNGLNKAYAASKGEVTEESAAETTETEKPEVTFGADAFGFQSDVYVEAAFEDDKVTWLSIGDKRFEETPGLGEKALEPEFQAQFIGKALPLAVSDIDAITGATFTTNAVVEALNKAYDKSLKAAETAEEPAAVAKPENTVTASAQGFGGPVAVEAAFEDGKISWIAIGDSQFAETPGLGAKAQEDAFQAQFIGKQMPLTLSDIDAIAGATITSTAVVDALNSAYASVNGETKEAPAAETTETEKPEVTFGADAFGFQSDVYVEAAFEDDKVTWLSIGDKRFEETPGLGEKALEPEFQAQFIGKALPLAVSDIDAITGATFTTNAVVEALNKAYDKSLKAAETAEEPAAVAKPENTVTASAQGFGGPVAVEAAFEDGKISWIAIGDSQFAETPGLGAKAQEDAFQAQFIGKTMPLALTDIDAIAGATITSTAVVDALNAAYEQAAPAKEVQPEEVQEEEAASVGIIGGADGPTTIVLTENDGGAYTGEAISFFTAIQVEAEFDGDKLANLKVNEKAVGADAYVPSAQEEAMKKKFIGSFLPLDANQDTAFASAVAIALNEAFAKSPAFADTAEKPWYTGECLIFFDRIEANAIFDENMLAEAVITKTPVGGDVTALLDGAWDTLLGSEMPLSVEQVTVNGAQPYTVQAVVIALNQAYENSLAGQQ